jgi:hypothetical protein
MCPTRSDSGQHLLQGMVHRRLLIRVKRVDGVHMNLERITRKRFFALTRQSYTDASPVHLGSVAETKYPLASSALMACDAVPRVVA